MTMHLRSVTYLSPQRPEYPFHLALWNGLQELTFTQPLTFFVGDNGSGKSTLLEGLAATLRLPSLGSQALEWDDSLEPARQLSRHLVPRWAQGKASKRGFFLRTEDFFGFIRRTKAMRQDLVRDIAEAERLARERGASDYAVRQAMSPMQGQVSALDQRYGVDIDAASHGESFLGIMQQRVVPQGLYLLDEPEAALSPMSELALIAFLKESIEENGCQFLIATHSPVLLSYPDAQIIHFGGDGLSEIAYEDLEHVRFTREFLNDPRRFLRHIWADG